ncbi:MAG: hypothetical protein A3F94_03230 [Candidatus Spechtbacteria bacterium RIFCSPLOWO2_12_FULL_38_22]|uniref:Transcription elongation factor GreA n=1 Tax=Candidatus Spechtbacteria bacterium RIFCSPLOWO2_12_FULL_38_22 TaxID=1802165 RepID=A0A1G2HJ92_9BACT|nr:MAG: hypothetical protein A2728_00355 [Candidatus Spechtbacteria bacterium RIFCSPHIGHO2_01_FULL_38_11]OGZ60239.1 MAG: hypothetical protein A3A00_00060 [Candidatus Spechtbacteria bacterium RIFCSPLOWO2_01_FULL_38_20]OGZ62340.1 MAG: hypothetical protein A3F94_03230 [Candidatus Spechtbacteria bacterium RIFCSPLOWO2_12_FULL_38_22]
MMEEYYVTQKAFNQLKEELSELETKKKWEIAAWLREASAQGDMSENAEYIEAKEAQTALENRVKDLEEKIRKAKIVRRERKGVVEVGATVEFATVSHRKAKVTLVSSEETEVDEGKISNESPLGKAMMGKKEGEYFEVITPKGKKRYRITKLI